MVKYVIFLITVVLFVAVMTLYKKPIVETQKNSAINPTLTTIPIITSITIAPVYQTFNNCGPASLSMILAYNGITKNQKELADILRPYRNPKGDNDDKSISTTEYIQTSRSFGLYAIARPNGSEELLKKLLSNNIPVVVKTWLNPGEDIGHFRIVTGYSDVTRQFYQVDSYQGPKNIQYETFLEMWQPFNYEYMVVTKPENQQIAEAILSTQIDEMTAWRDALQRAQNEQQIQTANPYPLFNQVVAQYHLGEYIKSVELFEQVEQQLPPRMLWYQLEPIEAYEKIGNHDRVISLTDKILNNHNRAYSELYLVRGNSYSKIGDKSRAREEYEKAVFYNNNFQAAKDALVAL